MDKYSIIACLGLIFIVSYLFLRWKQHEGILLSLGMSVSIVVTSIISSAALYLLGCGLIRVLKAIVEQNIATGVVLLLVCITLIVDVIIYAVKRVRDWRYEQVRQKLTKLLIFGKED